MIERIPTLSMCSGEGVLGASLSLCVYYLHVYDWRVLAYIYLQLQMGSTVPSKLAHSDMYKIFTFGLFTFYFVFRFSFFVLF